MDFIEVFCSTLKVTRNINNILEKFCKFFKSIRYSPNLKKYEFWLQKVVFLGHVISKVGVSMDPEKVEVIKDWPRPTNVTKVLRFINFVGYYRRFMKRFLKITTPLMCLTHKGATFIWS